MSALFVVGLAFAVYKRQAFVTTASTQNVRVVLGAGVLADLSSPEVGCRPQMERL
jgi:hypothetical protein